MVNKHPKFVCYVGGSNLSNFQLDEIRCAFARVGTTLNDIYFGQICIFLLIIIMVISIFGRIKENYRWFILNQAIWDLLTTFFFILNNNLKNFVTNFQLDGSYKVTKSSHLHVLDFFIDVLKIPELFEVIQEMVEKEPYSALLLLCISRFLCLYFPIVYKGLTRERRILNTIIIFNLIVLSFHLKILFNYLNWERRLAIQMPCFDNAVTDDEVVRCFTERLFESDPWYIVWNILLRITSILSSLKPLIFLIVSIFASIMIFFPLSKRVKFQLKNNHRVFLNSLRISLVLLFQTCLYISVFAVNFMNFLQELSPVGILVWYAGSGGDFGCPDDYFLCFDLELPLWIYGHMGLNDDTIIQFIFQIRIFLESIIVLALMTGYREVIINFVKFICRIIRKPFVKIRPRVFIVTSVSTVSTGNLFVVSQVNRN